MAMYAYTLVGGGDGSLCRVAVNSTTVNHVIERDGLVVARSRNLRGLRDYARRHGTWIKRVYLMRRGYPNGMMAGFKVRFGDGAYFRSQWGSYKVLQLWVRNWRTAYGAELLVNNNDCGVVSRNNPALATPDWSPPWKSR